MRYFVGLDLGQASDYTAIAVLEQRSEAAAPSMYERPRAAPPARYDCRHLERVKLGTPYPAVVERVRTLLHAPALRGKADLVVDATGVGKPVVDLLRQEKLRPVPVTITGGDTANRDGAGWRVPKRDLVGVLQVLLQTERLKFAAGLPDVPTLVQEMMAFRVKIDPQTAHDSYGSWREGSHDDLVLAVAVAAWYAEWKAGRPKPNLWFPGMSYRSG
jgi:hypothetical protein